ncbi:MAG: hypothetical protein C1943_07770 [Halochromatium sp.]|nr:hypothetical protein [Halochromatium sp.]
MSQRTDDRTKVLSEARKKLAKGRLDAAILALSDLLADSPEDDEVAYTLAQAYLRAERPALALDTLMPVASRQGQSADVWNLLGDIHQSLGRHEAAIAHYQQALKQDAHQIQALTSLGWLLHIHRLASQEAAELLEKAISLKPSHYPAHLNLAVILFALDRSDDAMRHGQKALELGSKDIACYVNVANLYQQLGDKSEAIRLLEKASVIDPTNGQTYFYLSRLQTFDQSSQKLLNRMEAALELPLTVTGRTSVHFALGKAYNDLQEWDHAFKHYQQGNQLIREDYNPREQQQFVARLTRFFSAKYFQAQQALSTPETPIFIVGMPRSGSTLIEQILASHPNTHSLGEALDLPDLVNQLCASFDQRDGKKKTPYPLGLGFASNQDLQSIVDAYLKRAYSRVDDPSTRVIDKQLFNYIGLGIIAILFPKARIIHTRRHPLDTCLSCYFQYFTLSTRMPWSYDLNSIGHYYWSYRQIMAHWRRVLPLSMFEIDYETLIAKPEETIRHLLEFCGLTWNPTVMHFYEKKHLVRTASLIQVRKPIYRDSLARWKHYANHLQPLVDALGNLLTDEAEALEAAGLRPKASLRHKLMPFWRNS